MATIVATHKCGIPTGYYSVGTWCKLPSGIRGSKYIKNLHDRGTTNYNCLEACIRLHLSSNKLAFGQTRFAAAADPIEHISESNNNK